MSCSLTPPAVDGPTAGQEYVQLLQQHHMVPSMSRPAKPYDNASCESFMKTQRAQITGLFPWLMNELYLDDLREKTHRGLMGQGILQQLPTDTMISKSL